MSLGLDTPATLSDAFAGLSLVLVLGLANWASRSLTLKMGRFPAYLTGWFGLYASWPWLAGVYLPSTEVVTAVGPALSHWYQIPWQAPYGLPWYVLNTLLWHIGDLFRMPYGLGWMTVLMILNVPFLYLFRKSELLTAYFMTSFFLWAVLPWDLSVLWFVVIGFLGSSFLPRLTTVLSAVLVKIPLPVSPSQSAFQYDFVNGQEHGALGSAFVPGHVMPYLVLGAWSIAVLVKPYIRFLSLDSYTIGQLKTKTQEHRGASEGSGPVTGTVAGSGGTGTAGPAVEASQDGDKPNP